MWSGRRECVTLTPWCADPSMGGESAPDGPGDAIPDAPSAVHEAFLEPGVLLVAEGPVGGQRGRVVERTLSTTWSQKRSRSWVTAPVTILA